MKKPKKKAAKKSKNLPARADRRPPRPQSARASSPRRKEAPPRRVSIKAPGLYPGMSAIDYHADPCAEPSVSASLLALVDASSPAHAMLTHPRLNPDYREKPPSKEMEFGTAAHCVMLGGPALVEVKAKDYTTSAAKTARDVARAGGFVPVLTPQIERLRGMKAKLIGVLPKIAGFEDFFTAKGESEVVAVWKEDGLFCRGRADRWFPPGAMKGFRNGLIVDYKTTGEFMAAPESWQRTCFNIGGDFQSTWYREGFASALRLSVRPDFLFIVQETVAPYELQLYAPDEIMREHTTNKIVRSFARWKESFLAKSFEGYPRSVAYLSPPAWDLKAEERAALATQVLYRPEGVR